MLLIMKLTTKAFDKRTGLLLLGESQIKGHVYCRLRIQLFRERLSEKSTKVHATIPKSNLGHN